MKSLKEIVEATRGHNLESASLKQTQLDALSADQIQTTPATNPRAEIVVVSPPVAEGETDSKTLTAIVPESPQLAPSTTTVPSYEINFQLPGNYDLATDESILRLEKLAPPRAEMIGKPAPEPQPTESVPQKSSSSVVEARQTTSPVRSTNPTVKATDHSLANSHEARDKATERFIESIIADNHRQLSVAPPTYPAADSIDADSSIPLIEISVPTISHRNRMDPPTHSSDTASTNFQMETISWLHPKSIAVNKVAQRLRDSISIQHASSLLLVTSGPQRQFRTAAEDVALALTAQLKRTGVLTEIAMSAQTTTAQPERAKAKKEICHHDWQSLATDYRFQQNGQLSVIEVTIDSQTLMNSPEDFKNIFRQQAGNHELSLWLTDHNSGELFQYLAAACDVTLMLVDLDHSSVDDCHIAVTQLREHGSRLLGTVILRETKGRSSWVKS
jgi:hypothetical protein